MAEVPEVGRMGHSMSQNQNQNRPSPLDDLRGTVKVCLRCGHQWASKVPGGPKACTRCKSYRWQEPKRQVSGRKVKGRRKAQGKAPGKLKQVSELVSPASGPESVSMPAIVKVQVQEPIQEQEPVQAPGPGCAHEDIVETLKGERKCRGCGLRVEG